MDSGLSQYQYGNSAVTATPPCAVAVKTSIGNLYLLLTSARQPEHGQTSPYSSANARFYQPAKMKTELSGPLWRCLRHFTLRWHSPAATGARSGRTGTPTCVGPDTSQLIHSSPVRSIEAENTVWLVMGWPRLSHRRPSSVHRTAKIDTELAPPKRARRRPSRPRKTLGSATSLQSGLGRTACPSLTWPPTFSPSYW
jgi:hypothetical protein